MIQIDGSQGEGGGQILRTSLSLSLVTGQPFRIENIRARRDKPGLLRQHLASVRAAAEVGGAEIEGDSLGSATLTFHPGEIRPGHYHFDVGSAGSGTLVFQTILPVLLRADGPSRVVIEGGTHNSGAPPFHFLQSCFVPLVERMGPVVSLNLQDYGFYPAGGGRFTAEIVPAPLVPLHLGSRGEIISRRVRSVVARLPKDIAQREVETASRLLKWDPDTHSIQTLRGSPGPGNLMMIEVGTAESTEMFTAFGRIGVSAEMVAKEAAREAREYLAASAIAGEHLTDQLLLPMALAGGASFTAIKLNLHARTNMDVISTFLPIRFETTEEQTHVRVSVTTR